MDEQQNMPQRPTNPRRRPRSKMRVFKETYLPVIILGAALVLILVLIFGAIFGSSDDTDTSTETKPKESEPIDQEQLLQQEAADIMYRAEAYAEIMDYDNAIRTLQSFTGDLSDPQFADMAALYDQLVLERSQMVPWNDPGEVMHLCVQLLIADPDRAFNDDSFSDSFRKNFLTTDEFTKILPQLYENGYILVSMEDILSPASSDGYGTVYEAKTLYLPQGKKPLLLTQTNVNYPNYLIDSDYDNIPDAGGSGFASRLVYDESGNIACEYVDAEGQTLVGAYDMIPILDQFVAEHPDFSYQGARAVLAVTGYDGIFGYRTNPEVRETQGSEYYAQQLSGAQKIVDALKEAGYDLACYSYENISYGDSAVDLINGDLSQWAEQVTPILGDVDILVYPYGDDIYDGMTSVYSGDKYDALYNAGFRIFVGMNNDMPASAQVTDSYFRQTRRWVTGAKMTYASESFADLFNSAAVLNNQRGEVPADE